MKFAETGAESARAAAKSEAEAASEAARLERLQLVNVVADLRGSGRSCSVATGKSRRGLDFALASSGLGDHFEITRCADETRSKPDPAMLEEILRFYRIEPEEAVMIGDWRLEIDEPWQMIHD